MSSSAADILNCFENPEQCATDDDTQRFECSRSALRCERAEGGAFDSLSDCASQCYSYNAVNGTCVPAPVNAGAFTTAEECMSAMNPALKATTSDEQCHWHFVGPCTADEGYDSNTCASYAGQCYSTSASQCRTSDDCSTGLDLTCKNRREGGGSLYCQRSLGVCTCFHQEASALVWPSIVDAEAVKLSFPEQCAYPKLGDPQKLGIAFSGGGSRAYSCSMGMSRALTRSSLLDGADYVSTNSGGGWFYGTYTFARGTRGLSADTLLGQSRAPQDITLANLSSDNNYYEYMGQRVTNIPNINIVIESIASRGQSIHDAWPKIIGLTFLEPYGIDKNVPVAADEAHAARIYEQNPELGMPIVPLQGGPFFITTSTAFEPKLKAAKVYPVVNMTPMYSGVISVGLGASGLGGRWIETFAEGCDAPDPSINTIPKRARSCDDATATTTNQDSNAVMLEGVSIAHNAIVTLRDVLGASSAAHGAVPLTPQATLPHYRAWSPESPGFNTEVSYSDGATVDDLGVAALLARGVTHIISLNSLEFEIDSECQPFNLMSLFGVLPDECWLYGLTLARNAAQVFERDAWPGVHAQLLRTKLEGGPTYARAKLRVKKNAMMGVEGGYDADILFIIVQRSPRFFAQLPAEVVAELGPSGAFKNFPYIPVVFANLGGISEYTLAQANLLASYTDWLVSQPEVQAHVRELAGETFNYADAGDGTCVMDDLGAFDTLEDCVASINYTFDWQDGVGCAARERLVGETPVTLAQCVMSNRPSVQNDYPNFTCSKHTDTFQPYVNRSVDASNVLYLQCLTKSEAAAAGPHLEPANAHYAPPSTRGKMGTWCDTWNNCPSGSWCCADAFNKSRAPHSGRCVYCNDNDSFCWAAGDESASNTCATNNMQVF
jgi:hypothetical protein